jgi:membrane fusion protein, multidrug efflux system
MELDTVGIFQSSASNTRRLQAHLYRVDVGFMLTRLETQLLKTRHEGASVPRPFLAEGANLMSTSPVAAGPVSGGEKPGPHKIESDGAVPPRNGKWQRYVTPVLVVLLALAVLITITRNWNAWEGGKAEQVTDDAYVRGDVTPLSTKVAGIVCEVNVADYQPVHKGDLIVALEDDDYQAQVDQAKAAVEAARAAIEENLRQRQLQDTRIAKAMAGIDQAKAQITAAEAGKAAVEAELVRARSERKRQESLFQTHSTTEQNLETAVAGEGNLSAQFASRDADLKQAQTMLRSSELAAEAEQRTKIVLESQEAQLSADLHAKQASLAAVQVNLGYTKIYAPGDGSVGERQVRPGQLVSPGTQVISFVAVTKWVQANYRETQLTNVKIGDAAELRIDEYPGQTIRGKVVEIAPASGSQFALLPPDNATGNFTKVVQRIPVKITLDDSNFAASLRPGLSVVAAVRTRQ